MFGIYIRKAKRQRSTEQNITNGNEKHIGFSLIELLVVLTMIALLAGIVTPLVSKSIQRSKESVLKENLLVLRKMIDDYYADTGDYPAQLQELVTKRYLRRIPLDPMTNQPNWHLIYQDEEADEEERRITDVQSSSASLSRNGDPVNTW